MGLMHQVRGKRGSGLGEPGGKGKEAVVVAAEPVVVEKNGDGFAGFVRGRGVRGSALALGISQGSVVKYCRGGAPRLVMLAVWALERGAEV